MDFFCLLWKKSVKIPKRGNPNPCIEEKQTTQWPKEKVQIDKQRSTKNTHKTDRTPLQTENKESLGNACTKSGSLRSSQFSGCWLILSVYIYLWLLTFPLEDCSEFGKFVIILIKQWRETNTLILEKRIASYYLKLYLIPRRPWHNFITLEIKVLGSQGSLCFLFVFFFFLM